MTIRHRLYALERLAGPAPPGERPPPPKWDICHYFRTGLIAFAHAGVVRSIALFDPSGGDIAAAVQYANWELRQRPAVWILLDSDEIELAIVAEQVGSYHKGDYIAGLHLSSAVNAAVQAWQDQTGEELPPGGVVELLRSWRGVCSEF